MSRNVNVMRIVTLGKVARATVQICLAVVIATLLLTTPAATSAMHAQDEVVHVVQSGESLYSIATHYGVNMYTLARYNGIANVNIVRVGQVLRIPSTSAPSVSPAPAPAVQPRPKTDYVAPAGTPVATPTPYVVDGDRPTPTPTRVVPTPIARSTTLRVHIVAAFDTLTSIANLYGTSVSAIKARNGLVSDRIYRGQQLIIP